MSSRKLTDFFCKVNEEHGKFIYLVIFSVNVRTFFHGNDFCLSLIYLLLFSLFK